MDIIKAIIYGIIEGITEWLPVSSTGHMILMDEFMKLDVSPAFWDLFLVVIQLGAILAVIVNFIKKLWPLGFKSSEEKKIVFKKDILLLWAKIIVACLPAAILGIVISKTGIKDAIYHFITVAIMLILYGIIFIVVEKFVKKRQDFKYKEVLEIDFKTALFIGLFQVLSLIPGTSRSGVTIIGALILGCSRTVGAEFTFYLSIPVMLGASLFEGVDFFLDGNTLHSKEIIILLTASITAFVVSLVCIKGLMNFVKKHDFKVFGIYRIVLGIILIIYFIVKYVIMG